MSSILAAELAKAKAKFEHEKIHGREKKTEKQTTHRVARNRGVEERISRDDKYRVSKSSSQKTGYENMQRKAELYRQFHHGEIEELAGGVMERRMEEGRDLVSCDSDDPECESDSSADSSEIEIVDEFGRTRMVPKSKRYLFEARKAVARDGYGSHNTVVTSRDMVEKPANVIYGDIVQTDSFTRNDFVPQENEVSNSHYDSTKEIRNRGVGFMQFSQDAEVRERQQKELKEARAVTQAFIEEKNKEKGIRAGRGDLERFKQRSILSKIGADQVTKSGSPKPKFTFFQKIAWLAQLVRAISVINLLRVQVSTTTMSQSQSQSHTPVNSFNSKEALDFLNLRYSQASNKAKQNTAGDKEGSVLYKPQAQAWSDGSGPNKTDFLSEFKKASDEFKA
ncbi:hypothetical protein B0I72DRAFT_174403 [Yarrowia lipolytica]|uniref:Uncharacterized protein n=1 Tax=Yarrowia lipolytica TaxID=4952 RepID=A0A371C9F8_YARLL|nr:hypothetical protein B0I71DRAFT_163969 [Yarrowia lipolytica]RDW32639.1 hypothetical protein B0I72DRAFT_174403 [Yarrowia lipolytica]